MSKRKYGVAEKLVLLNEVSSGNLGFLTVAKKYEINKIDELTTSLQAVWL